MRKNYLEPKNLAPSAVVPRDPISDNLALNQQQSDYGLRPNGLTIDQMRELGDLASPTDDIDKIGIARMESAKLSSALKETSEKAQAAHRKVFGKSFVKQSKK